MGRRTSGGTVGLEKIGNVQANLATLTTTQLNSDLTLDPNGTGSVQVNASVSINGGDISISNQGDLRLFEATANGTNYIAMQAAANMTSNYTITWPAAVSAVAGYVLSSDASGNLSWTNPSSLSIGVSDPGAVATIYYPFFGTNAGSLPTSFAPNARTNLQFVPSTGELAATLTRTTSIYGNTSASATLTLRGTTNATKATASVLMTDNVASSSTTTGTLVVTGGVGISGATYVGGNLVVSGTAEITGATTFTGAGIFNGGQVDFTAANTFTYDSNGRVTGFVEGPATYSLITYTQFGTVVPEFKVTSYQVVITGIGTKTVTITYNANGTINTYTVV